MSGCSVLLSHFPCFLTHICVYVWAGVWKEGFRSHFDSALCLCLNVCRYSFDIVILVAVILSYSTCWSQCAAEEVAALTLILIYSICYFKAKNHTMQTLTHTHTQWPALSVLGPQDIANSLDIYAFALKWEERFVSEKPLFRIN